MINEIEVNSIDLSYNAHLINEQEYKSYYLSDPGQEHYKLLAYYSMQFNDAVLLDVGTYKGCSALALSHNPKNQVKSFDIRSGLRNLSDYPTNVEFIIGNILDEEYKPLMLSSKVIVLDTDHLGEFEHKFYNHLKSVGYKGTLILDDIKLNPEMVEFWNSISDEKHDISYLGHNSGTGLVFLK